MLGESDKPAPGAAANAARSPHGPLRAIADFAAWAGEDPPFNDLMNEAVTLAAREFDAPLTKILRFEDSADSLKLAAGIGWRDGLVGQAAVGIDRDSQAGFTLMHDDPILVDDLQTETRFHGPPLLHEHGVRSGMSVIIPGPDRRAFGVFGVHRREPRAFLPADVDLLRLLADQVGSAGRRADESARMRLLTREMAHRAGNLLQIVNAVAAQSFRDAGDPQGRPNEVFAGRLAALSRSNQVVSSTGWRPARLQLLAEEALAPFSDRIVMEGRDVVLPSALCFDLGLVLYELATNSVKYGVLGAQASAPVRLSWEVSVQGDGRRLDLIWRDPVSRPAPGAPSTGFGTRLIESTVQSKWRGTLKRAEGSEYELEIRIPLPERAGA